MMVSSLSAFERYQHHDAWTWEHQALVRARALTPGTNIANAFDRIRVEILTQARELDTLKKDVREMREKMWQEHASKDEGVFDLKKDPGGITDIEFMVQYSVLAHAKQQPGLTHYTDNIHVLAQLAEYGLIRQHDAELLIDAYRHFRDRIHVLTLQEQSSQVPEHEFQELRAGVQRLWAEVMD
jgi:glutamate-ammonia-ligase adenylyltransferase